jgi:hypothetical protein
MWGAHRAGRSIYSPEIVLWGGNHNDLDAVLFTRVVISCNELLEISKIGRQVEHRSTNMAQSEIAVPLRRNLIAPADCGKLGIITIEERWMESGDSDGGWSVRPEVFATISSHIGYSISNVMEILYRSSISFRFICSRRPRYKIIEMWNDNATGMPPCGIIINQSKKSNEVYDFRFFCPRMPSGASIIEKALKSIYSEAESTLLAISHFHYAIDNSSSAIEYRFFDMARVFETINGGTKLNSGSQHRKLVDGIIDNIPKGIAQDYQNRIKEQLAHAHEPSFRTKFERFILDDSQANDLCPDHAVLPDFITRIVKGRNAFAHLGDSYGGLQWSDIEILARLIDLRFWRIFGCNEIDLSQRYGEWASRTARNKYKESQIISQTDASQSSAP